MRSWAEKSAKDRNQSRDRLPQPGAAYRPRRNCPALRPVVQASRQSRDSDQRGRDRARKISGFFLVHGFTFSAREKIDRSGQRKRLIGSLQPTAALSCHTVTSIAAGSAKIRPLSSCPIGPALRRRDRGSHCRVRPSLRGGWMPAERSRPLRAARMRTGFVRRGSMQRSPTADAAVTPGASGRSSRIASGRPTSVERWLAASDNALLACRGAWRITCRAETLRISPSSTSITRKFALPAAGI